MYNLYATDYTTYERVNEQLKSNPTEGELTNDQSIVEYYIHVASRMVTDYCNRTFVPYIKTDATVMYTDLSAYFILNLPDDALVVTSITGDNDSVIPTTQYRLLDIFNQDNGYPYRYVELSSQANIYINISSWDFVPRFTIDGIWGFSRQSYANSWETITTMALSIDDETTSITVVNATLLETFDYLRLGTEFMQITAIVGNVLTVTRGVNGSTAAAHDGTGTPVNVDRWQIEQSVKDATTRLTAWLYTSRQTTGNTLVFGDGTVATQYPSLVWSALFMYKKPVILSV